ncbi:MAG: NeuD/PglB/VioB family sugar acetyltransferase [bacterium]|nr:NeuD/PglB/VioB family sugar acetyltransferase [bacterium]
MVEKAIYGIYGAGGCGRGIMPLAREQLQCLGISSELLVFIDDQPQAGQVNGQRIVRYAEILACPATERHVALAIANSAVREKLAQQCSQDGILPWTVQAANVVVMDEVQIGQGALLCPFVTLTSNIQIGRYFHANLYSYVEHDCIIGDYVTFAPGVHCNGNIVIEDHAYIGTGAIIKQGNPGRPLVIGHHAVVGMGAVVTKDVPAGTTVIGNPARLLQKG